MLGRKTLKSERARIKRVDQTFAFFFRAYLILYFIFSIISWWSYRPSVRITSIEVTGTHAVDPVLIKETARPFLEEHLLWKIDRNNLFFYPRRAIERALFPLDAHIASLDISVDHMHTLKIHVSEFIPSMLWCSFVPSSEASTTDKCFLADERGYIFSEAPEYSGYPFIRYHTPIEGSAHDEMAIGKMILPSREFVNVNAFVAQLEHKGVLVHDVTQNVTGDYTFSTDQAWSIRWSTSEDATTSITNLSLVLHSITGSDRATTSPKLIDLRFGNKIFYH